MEQAEELVRAVMDYCGDDDQTRIATLRATFRKGDADKPITGADSLRKLLPDVVPVVEQVLAWLGGAEASVVDEYNARHAVVNLGGKFRVADCAQVPFSFSTQDDFVKLRAPDTIVGEEGKRIPKARIWLGSTRRRQYDGGVDFLPGLSEDDCPDNVLNLWTGWAVAPSAEGSCEAWQQLLRDVVCGGDEVKAQWLDNWFAGVVRDPLRKPGTAPVIVGEFGAGKTMLIDYVGRMLGPHYTLVTQEEHVHGKFNRHLSECLLLHSEEALTARDRKHRGIVKSLITDRFTMRELKGVDAQQVTSCLRLALTSNELDAAPVEPGDRGFTIFDLEDRVISEKLTDRVVAERDGGGPARLLHRYLYEFEYDAKLVRTNVKDEALAEMMAHTSDPVRSYWEHALTVGEVLPDYLSWAKRPQEEAWPTTVSLTALHCAIAIAAREHRWRGTVPNTQGVKRQLEKFLRRRLARSDNAFTFPNPLHGEEGVPSAPPEARQLSDRQRALLGVPSLAECRAAWDRHCGVARDWDDDTEPGRKF